MDFEDFGLCVFLLVLGGLVMWLVGMVALIVVFDYDTMKDGGIKKDYPGAETTFISAIDEDFISKANIYCTKIYNIENNTLTVEYKMILIEYEMHPIFWVATSYKTTELESDCKDCSGATDTCLK